MKVYKKLAKEAAEFMGLDCTENRETIDALAEQLQSNYTVHEAPEEWWETLAYEETLAFMEEKLGPGAMDEYAKEVRTDSFEEWLSQTRAWLAERAVGLVMIGSKISELKRNVKQRAREIEET